MSENVEIDRLIGYLPEGIETTNSRNYQTGSVYVQKNNKIIGLCLDRIPPHLLSELNLDPSYFPDLIDLVIRSSPLSNIPEWVNEFNQVENLILKNLRLSNLQLDLNRFTKLRFLALPNNHFTDLPSFEGNDLFRINLNRNKLEIIPNEVVELPNLISLMMDENFITEAPQSIKSHHLQAISLENNQLTIFPEFLQDQLRLYSADLSRNFIQTVPKWIEQFAELEYLNLGWNQIRRMPEEITGLQKVRLLELQSNPLEEFPSSFIYGLSNLGILNLEDTFELPTIPDKIRAYRKLFELNFVVKY